MDTFADTLDVFATTLEHIAPDPCGDPPGFSSIGTQSTPVDMDHRDTNPPGVLCIIA
ncbi:hypothetical protein BDW22DRAFT_1359460 [Trametopsis cervina]|nr:hypothetical protein BDW22DRAFT_1359460 [Trametopsis cervina]